jgi:SNF2 family DNA or RNA helicase
MMKITAIQDGLFYNVRFQYNPDLVELVKGIPGRSYVPDKKMWTIPKDKLGWLQGAVERAPAYMQIKLDIVSEENINVNETMDETTVIPDIDISDVDQYVVEGSKLFQHQLDFLKYAKNRCGAGFVLADEMGCGKSNELTNYALYRRKVDHIKHCLIICCVSSAKFSWRDDIEKHTNGQETGYILGLRKYKRKSGVKYPSDSLPKYEDLVCGHMYGDKAEPELPFFLLINIEALQFRSGKAYPIVDMIIRLVNSGEIGMIALDEIHKNASPKSTQGKLLLKIKEKTGCNAQWIPMTGTPIVNKPTDVFTPLKLVDGHNVRSFYDWQKLFCIFGGYGDHEVLGYKNIPELKKMLQKHMIRRLKESVLDLPPKMFYTEYVENTPYQTKLYMQVMSGIVENKAAILASSNPLAEFIRLRQVNGYPEAIDATLEVDASYVKYNAKLKRLLELVDEIIERGEKLVIFSNRVGALRPIYKFLSGKYKVCCFTGTMTDEKREAHKKAFITNPDCKIMIGTIGALGTNHTLTVANNVILYDEPWNPATRDQAIDRCHRISATKPVNVYTLLSAGTIDETVHKIIEDKDCMSKYIVDGNLDIRRNPELFDKILGTI